MQDIPSISPKPPMPRADEEMRRSYMEGIDADPCHPAAVGAAAAVPALAAALNDPEASVRKYASIALGNIGPVAAAAVPALVAALKDSEDFVRLHASISLGKIQGEKAGRPKRSPSS
jgi:HEAT repeats